MSFTHSGLDSESYGEQGRNKIALLKFCEFFSELRAAEDLLCAATAVGVTIHGLSEVLVRIQFGPVKPGSLHQEPGTAARHPWGHCASRRSNTRNTRTGDLLEVISPGSGGPPPPTEHSHPFIDVVPFFCLSFVRAVKAGFSLSLNVSLFSFLSAPIRHVYRHSVFCS